MKNLIEQHNFARNLSDEQIQGELRNPTGTLAPWLLASVAEGRKLERSRAPGKPQGNTVVESLISNMAGSGRPVPTQQPQMPPPKLPPPPPPSMSSDQPQAVVQQGLNGFSKGNAVFDKRRTQPSAGVRARNYKDFPYDYSIHGIDFDKYAKAVEGIESSNDPTELNSKNHIYGGLYGMDVKSPANVPMSYAYYAKRMGLKPPSFFTDSKGKLRVNIPEEEQRLIYREGYLPDNIKAMTRHPDEVTGAQQFTPTELYVGHRNGAGTVERIMNAYRDSPDTPMSELMLKSYKTPEFAKKVTEQNRLTGLTVGDDINNINRKLGLPIYNINEGASNALYDSLESGRIGEYRPNNMSDNIQLDRPDLYAQVADHPALKPEAPPAMTGEQAQKLKDAKNLSDFDELLKNLTTSQVGLSMMSPALIPNPPQYANARPRQKPLEEGAREIPVLKRDDSPTREYPDQEMQKYYERIQRIGKGQSLPGDGYSLGGVVGYATGDEVFQPFMTIRDPFSPYMDKARAMDSIVTSSPDNISQDELDAWNVEEDVKKWKERENARHRGIDEPPPDVPWTHVNRPRPHVNRHTAPTVLPSISSLTDLSQFVKDTPSSSSDAPHETAMHRRMKKIGWDKRTIDDVMTDSINRGYKIDDTIGTNIYNNLTNWDQSSYPKGIQNDPNSSGIDQLKQWLDRRTFDTGKVLSTIPAAAIGIGNDVMTGATLATRDLGRRAFLNDKELADLEAKQVARSHGLSGEFGSVNLTGDAYGKADAPVSTDFLNNGLEDFGAPILSQEQLDAPQRGADDVGGGGGGGGITDISLESAMKMARRPQGKMETMLNNSIERLMGQKQTPEQADFDEGIRRMKTAAAMMGYGGTLAGPHIAAGMSTYADSLAAEKAQQQGLEYKNLGLLGDAATLEGQRADKEYAGGIDIYVARLNAQAKIQAAQTRKQMEQAHGLRVPDGIYKLAFEEIYGPATKDPMEKQRIALLTPEQLAVENKIKANRFAALLEENAQNALFNQFGESQKVDPTPAED